MPATVEGKQSSVREVAAAVIAEDVRRHGVGDRIGKATPRLGWLIPAVALLVLLGGGVGYGLARAQVGPFAPATKPATAVAVVALSLSPITATLLPPRTTYQVTATSPAGKPLTYEWSKDNPCGDFLRSQSTATWFHPHGPPPNCPEHEPHHPGIITVTVSDGRDICRANYLDGSNAGTGQPASCEARP